MRKWIKNMGLIESDNPDGHLKLFIEFEDEDESENVSCPDCGTLMKKMPTRKHPNFWYCSSKKCNIIGVELTKDGEIKRIFRESEPLFDGVELRKLAEHEKE